MLRSTNASHSHQNPMETNEKTAGKQRVFIGNRTGARVAALTKNGSSFFAFAKIQATVLLPITEVVYSSGLVPVCVIFPATESTQLTS